MEACGQGGKFRGQVFRIPDMSVEQSHMAGGWNSHGSREDRGIMWLVDRPEGKLLSSPERKAGACDNSKC